MRNRILEFIDFWLGLRDIEKASAFRWMLRADWMAPRRRYWTIARPGPAKIIGGLGD